MKNLKLLSDDHLEIEIKNLVGREREVLVEVLVHLREVDVRKLYLKRGCSSLFDYCLRDLHYSESAALRRINAMRLIKDIPEVAEKIETGDLNLSNVAAAQGVFKRDGKMDIADKKVILEKIENTSKRECEKILLQVAPEAALPKERARQLTPESTEIRFIANEELMTKLEKLKSLMSHNLINPSYAQLFEEMADQLLAKKDPALRKTRPAATPNKDAKVSPPPAEVKAQARENGPLAEVSAHSDSPAQARDSSLEKYSSPFAATNESPQKKTSRYIPAALKIEVWQRAGGKCQHCDPRTGERCDSNFQLQIDHKIPLALGGTTTLDNLELVCRSHNLLRANQTLGPDLMKNYWK